MKLTSLLAALAAAILFCIPMMTSAQAASVRERGANYCVRKGGIVQTRQPEYNTNGGTPLVLSGSADFCQFTSQSDGSQINVLLTTLSTDQPTLAALAYYSQTPLGQCSGNPGSCYCTLLGGTDLFGGINAAGGGWVLESDQSDVLESCIFPDMSSIDSWGLAYHSAGIVRGKDLSKVLRYPNPYTAANAHPPSKLGVKG
ncbi:MAG TPA: hypothetical protein VGM17_10055 [Rhizomicrobium sp.]|jgi:hypothetical protein